MLTFIHLMNCLYAKPHTLLEVIITYIFLMMKNEA